MSLSLHQSRRPGGVVFVGRHREMVFITREGDPSVRTAVMDEPGTDLLDRALVGWERFLDTYGVADE